MCQRQIPLVDMAKLFCVWFIQNHKTLSLLSLQVSFSVWGDYCSSRTRKGGSDLQLKEEEGRVEERTKYLFFSSPSLRQLSPVQLQMAL